MWDHSQVRKRGRGKRGTNEGIQISRPGSAREVAGGEVRTGPLERRVVLSLVRRIFVVGQLKTDALAGAVG